MPQLSFLDHVSVPNQVTIMLYADPRFPELPLTMTVTSQTPAGGRFSRQTALPGLAADWAPSIAQAVVEQHLYGEGLRAAALTAWKMGGDARSYAAKHSRLG